MSSRGVIKADARSLDHGSNEDKFQRAQKVG